MKWYRLKRRIRLKPNLIDPYRSISYREARRIWRTEGRPGALEILEGARKKAGKTPEEWEALTGLKQKQTYRTPGAAVRRWAFACVFVLLVSAFLAFTAPGRAFAAKVYRTFTTIAENILNIRATEERDTSEIEPEAALIKTERIKLSSLHEAQQESGKSLLYLPTASYILDEIRINHSETMGLIVWTKYTGSANSTILIEQRWPLEGQSSDLNLFFENASYYSTNTALGLIFHGAYLEGSKSYLGGAIQEEVLITLNVDCIDHPEEVDEIVQAIQYFKK